MKNAETMWKWFLLPVQVSLGLLMIMGDGVVSRTSKMMNMEVNVKMWLILPWAIKTMLTAVQTQLSVQKTMAFVRTMNQVIFKQNSLQFL